MTDKQIVAACMADILFNASSAPSPHKLRELSETNLSIQRRARLIDMIAEECARLRAFYVTQSRGVPHDA